MTKPSTANGGYPNVVVTAVAATTSVAPDIESTWKGLLAGESGIRVLEDEFVTKWDLPVKIGGHLKEPIDIHMGRLDLRRMSYVQRLAKYLSGQLWENAGNPEVDPDRFAVVVGTGLGGAERIVESYDLMNEGGPRKVSPLAVQMIMPNGAAAVVGLQLGARAGVITPVSACSSGSEAIAHAWRQIVMGDADFAVCGGVEGPIEALPIAAFSMMRAMSTRNDEPERASRPFDKDRDGFVFGEAGALMLIETEEHAKARGAKPLARLLGAGITSDAFHMVAPARGRRACRTGDDPRAGAGRRVRQGRRPHQRARDGHADRRHRRGQRHPGRRLRPGRGVCAEISAGPLHWRGRCAGVDPDGADAARRRHSAHAELRNTRSRDRPRCCRGRTSLRRIPYAINNSFGFGGHNVALAFGRY